MNQMFYGSSFDGILSGWDVSKVTDMYEMFFRSNFNGDVSDWVRISVIDDVRMFLTSKIARELNVECPTFDEVKRHFVAIRLEEHLQRNSVGQDGPPKVRL